ncbi:IclR family transcriptional regulator domain-containing protein [Alsobacter sp. R-9]
MRRIEQGETAEAAGAPGTGLVVKALTLIDLIAGAPGHHRAQSLAEETGLPRSTVYRILQTLQQRGMVRLDPSTQGYFPGFKFLDYAQAVWPAQDLPLLAMAEIRRLRELTGETVYFAVPTGADMIILQKAESAYQMRTGAPLGSRRPLYCTGMGKAYLAQLPAAERDALIGRMALEPLTARTITDPAQLRSQLDLFRLRGYAIDDEEFMEGARCVSAAVPAEGEGAVGAFTVSGPIYRMTSDRAHQLGPEVAAAARRLGDALRQRGGGRGRGRMEAGSIATVAPEKAFYGKSPCWDEGAGRLMWLDALAPAVLREADGGAEVLARFDGPVTAMAPVGNGCWFLSAVDGMRTIDRQGRQSAPVAQAGAGLLAAVTAACRGRGDDLWISVGEGPAAAEPAGLYRLRESRLTLAAQPEGAVTDVACDASGRVLYAAVPDRGEILQWEIDGEGLPSRPRTVARIDPIHGRPTALCIAETGHLWVALWDGWGVARLALDGGDMRFLPLPVPRPTGLAFGGRTDDTLFVTSSRIGLSPQQLSEAPASGSVFALPADLRQSLLR